MRGAVPAILPWLLLVAAAGVAAAHGAGLPFVPAGADETVQYLPPWMSMRPGPSAEVAGLEALSHRPLIRLVENDAWHRVVDTDAPTLTMYEDGLVIYHRLDGDHPVALRASVGPEGAADLVDRMLSLRFLDLPARMEGIGTDQPWVEILLRTGNEWHRSWAEGCSRRSLADGAGTWMIAPAFIDAYRLLASYEAPYPEPWVPEQIQVYIWEFPNAPTAEPWPEFLPRPPATLKPGPEPFDIFVDGSMEAAVRGFIVAQHYNATVQLNGVRWSLSYRRRVPSEDYLASVTRRLVR